MHVRRLLINDFSAVVVIRFVVVAFCTRLLLPGGALLLLLLLAAVLCTWTSDNVSPLLTSSSYSSLIFWCNSSVFVYTHTRARTHVVTEVQCVGRVFLDLFLKYLYDHFGFCCFYKLSVIFRLAYFCFDGFAFICLNSHSENSWNSIKHGDTVMSRLRDTLVLMSNEFWLSNSQFLRISHENEDHWRNEDHMQITLTIGIYITLVYYWLSHLC